MMIQGRDSFEVVKIGVRLRVCLREESMGGKNRNNSVTMLRIHIEGLLTELMIAKMGRKIA